MSRLFGTDGVRGVANTELTCLLAYLLGQAAAVFLGKDLIIGKDTRRSGDMLEAALVAGISSAGATAHLAGVIPTPGIALLVRRLSLDGGVVISASHNPPEYNGIKLFDAQGFKLPDALEDEIERFVRSARAFSLTVPIQRQNEHLSAFGKAIRALEFPDGLGVGRPEPVKDACDIYIEHAVQSIGAQGIDFDGMCVALDCGHGASSLTTAEALRRLGADVAVINDDYDGDNINVGCGSTHLDPLRVLMEESGADIGIAHDGDADRVMMMAPCGQVIDGDVIEAVLAGDMKRRGVLAGDTAVSTMMCNLGFIHAMRAAGIKVVQTKVGDRYVLEEMRKHGYALGGEQSGHVILLEYNSTGDGLMTAVQFLAAVARSGGSFDEAALSIERFPQTLINVRVADKDAVAEDAQVAAAVKTAEDALGDDGRVLLRPSGTEPLVRVMVEARDSCAAESIAQAVAAAVKSADGRSIG